MKLPSVVFLLLSAQFGVASVLMDVNFISSDSGFTVESSVSPAPEGPWTYDPAGTWKAVGSTDLGTPTHSGLISTAISIVDYGTLIVKFDHRYSFESNERDWDGGQLRISINGGAFTSILSSDFEQNGYNGIINPGESRAPYPILNGEEGFIRTSEGYSSGKFITSIAHIEGLNPGDSIRFQWFAGWDWYYLAGSPSWELRSVEIEQIPEPSVVLLLLPFTLIFFHRSGYRPLFKQICCN